MTTSKIFTHLSTVISIILGALAVFTEWPNDKIILLVVLFLYVIIFMVFKSSYFVIHDFAALVPSAFSKRIFRQVESSLLSRIDEFRGYATIEFASDFGDYCTRCSQMIEETNGHIYTVQTPHLVRGDYSEAFTRYLDQTVKKILEYSGGSVGPVVTLYRRLIVVDRTTLPEEQVKLERFLVELFQAANAITPPPSLDSVEVCIVHRKFAASLFYSNIDVHITSATNCAVAFHVPDGANSSYPTYEWRASLHVVESLPKAVSPMINALQAAYNQLWSLGVLNGGEFRFQIAYKHNISGLTTVPTLNPVCSLT